MKPQLFTIFSCFAFVALSAQTSSLPEPSPLSGFSSRWDEAKYAKCNTAANTAYLDKQEKDVIYILNLVRTDPKLFADSVVEKFPERKNQLFLKDVAEYRSLLDTLRKIKPLPLLYPDSLCFESAKCHAISSGEIAYVGHERKTEECKQKKHHQGECCQYGYNEALSIVMALLIDQYVQSLGHRFLCLSSYTKVGVAIRPHKGYGRNTVIDFYF